MRAITKTIFALVASLALLLAACGDDDTDTTEATTTTAADDTADDPADDPADDSADDSADGDDGGEQTRGVIGESMVGNVTAPAGTVVDDEVKVYFNNGTSGNMVAIYHGPGLADPTGLCPGNSLNGANGFEFVSNAPASDGACEGFPTPVGQVRVCTSNVWLYQTMIPNNSVGQLYGSLEASRDGSILNQVAVAENKPDTPEIDFSADVYEITAMFTADGATEITCAAALT